MNNEKLKTLGLEAIMVATYLVGGGAVGLAADAVHGSVTNEDFSPIGARVSYSEETIDNNTKSIIELSHDSNEMLLKIGEICVTSFQPYTAGGKLSNSVEGDIVSDLYLDERRPCGQTPTEIRSNLRSVITTEAQISTYQKEIKDTVNDLKILKKERTEDNNFDAWIYGAFLSLPIRAIRRINIRNQ